MIEPSPINSGVRVTFGLQLANAVEDVDHTGDEGENSGDDDDEEQWKEAQLQHYPRDRAHLANGRDFASPTRFHFDFADEQLQNSRADQNNDVTCDHQNRKPGREFSVIRLDLAPVADAQGNDSAKEQSFVCNR